MGDISNEPSMEDILSSIKRIIAEEGDDTPPPPRAKRVSRVAPVRGSAEPDVLELNEAIDRDGAHDAAARPVSAVSSVHAIKAPEAVATPLVEPRPVVHASTQDEPRTIAAMMGAEPIVSHRAAEMSRDALDALSRLVVKPEPKTADSLEGLVREMLRPMLREWLDAKLPTMVETLVAREIERITKEV
ncbi:MAG: DUF2497 domain-containing protein [Sphingomonas sp.]|jgi:hypothetical protein